MFLSFPGQDERTCSTAQQSFKRQTGGPSKSYYQTQKDTPKQDKRADRKH
jgi:hypothetical protein